MSTTVYVMKLASGKYYVGKTENLDERIDQHISGRGAAWTQKYKPVSVDKVIKNASSFDEDKLTKEYMAKHGIDNVRGGVYVKEKLDYSQKEAIQKEIWGATDCCTSCGRKGHFVKDCYTKNKVGGKKKAGSNEDEDDEDEGEEDEDEDEDEDEEDEEDEEEEDEEDEEEEDEEEDEDDQYD